MMAQNKQKINKQTKKHTQKINEHLIKDLQVVFI